MSRILMPCLITSKENNCTMVYLFDAHADLGYGGLSSLDFEVNCSNRLQILKEKQIKEANIFYSPYTTEKLNIRIYEWHL